MYHPPPKPLQLSLEGCTSVALVSLHLQLVYSRKACLELIHPKCHTSQLPSHAELHPAACFLALKEHCSSACLPRPRCAAHGSCPTASQGHLPAPAPRGGCGWPKISSTRWATVSCCPARVGIKAAAELHSLVSVSSQGTQRQMLAGGNTESFECSGPAWWSGCRQISTHLSESLCC